MGAQAFPHLAGYLGRMVNQGIKVTMGLQPLRRRLGPDLGNTRNVVAGVAHQGQVVDDALRRHAKFGFNTGRVQLGVGHGVHQPHPCVNQLGHVLVTGRDQSVPPLR